MNEEHVNVKLFKALAISLIVLHLCRRLEELAWSKGYRDRISEEQFLKSLEPVPVVAPQDKKVEANEQKV